MNEIPMFEMNEKDRISLKVLILILIFFWVSFVSGAVVVYLAVSKLNNVGIPPMYVAKYYGSDSTDNEMMKGNYDKTQKLKGGKVR